MDGETEWVVVKYTHIPLLPGNTVVGRYVSEEDALKACNALLALGAWFTDYRVERRAKGG